MYGSDSSSEHFVATMGERLRDIKFRPINEIISYNCII